MCYDLCDEEDTDNCDCALGIPYFSMTAAEPPSYYVFGVGLVITALLGFFGMEGINQMYFSLGRVTGFPKEPSLWRCAFSPSLS